MSYSQNLREVGEYLEKEISPDWNRYRARISAILQEEEELEREIQAVVDTIVDPAGTFYRFSMAHSLLQRANVKVG